jgi:hypothetical protein
VVSCLNIPSTTLLRALYALHSPAVSACFVHAMGTQSVLWDPVIDQAVPASTSMSCARAHTRG